jgi:hypothetical protein
MRRGQQLAVPAQCTEQGAVSDLLKEMDKYKMDIVCKKVDGLQKKL